MNRQNPVSASVVAKNTTVQGGGFNIEGPGVWKGRTSWSPVTMSTTTTADLEKQLRTALKNKTLFDQEVQDTRLRLRDAYEQAVLDDLRGVTVGHNAFGMGGAAGAGVASARDVVESNLWKLAHYKFIEEFRKRIKGIATKAKSRSGSSRSLSPDERRNMRILTASFRSFLTEATGFYLAFIQKLKNQFGLKRVHWIVVKKFDLEVEAIDEQFTAEGITVDMKMRATMTCHRSLIFLGDLARYREIHAEKKEKNWALARMFYTLALRLIPTIGNPFNQLAVIDTYEGDEVGAVERYFRSLVIQNPFPTAMENLVLLFRKARSKTDVQRIEGAEKNSDEAAFAKDFVGLHSLVFGKEQGLDVFLTAKPAILTKFADLVGNDVLDPHILFKLFIINMGSIYLTRHELHDSKRKDDIQNNHHHATANLGWDKPVHTKKADIEDALCLLMLDMALPILKVVLDHCKPDTLKRKKISDIPQDLDVELESVGGGTVRPVELLLAKHPLLPLVKIIAKWILSRATDEDRIVSQHPHEIWSSLAKFLNNAVGPPGSKNRFIHTSANMAVFTNGEKSYLEEDVELMGFVPVMGLEEGSTVVESRAEDAQDRETEGKAEEDGRRRLEQIVGVGVGLCNVRNPRLFMAPRDVVGSGKHRPMFSITPNRGSDAPNMNRLGAFTPPGLSLVGISPPAASSDDEEEVIVFKGRQRSSSRVQLLPLHTEAHEPLNNRTHLQDLDSMGLNAATSMEDVATEAGGKRSAIGSGRRYSSGLPPGSLLSPPLAQTTSVLSGNGINSAQQQQHQAQHPQSPLSPHHPPSSALFNTSSGIWQPHGDMQPYPVTQRVPSTGGPGSTGENRDHVQPNLMNDIINPFKNNGGGGTAQPLPLPFFQQNQGEDTYTRGVSIPGKPSAGAFFVHPGSGVGTPEGIAGSSFGAGTDAVNTMAFLGLGSPIAAGMRKGAGGDRYTVGDGPGGRAGGARMGSHGFLGGSDADDVVDDQEVEEAAHEGDAAFVPPGLMFDVDGGDETEMELGGSGGAHGENGGPRATGGKLVSAPSSSLLQSSAPMLFTPLVPTTQWKDDFEYPFSSPGMISPGMGSPAPLSAGLGGGGGPPFGWPGHGGYADIYDHHRQTLHNAHIPSHNYQALQSPGGLSWLGAAPMGGLSKIPGGGGAGTWLEAGGVGERRGGDGGHNGNGR